MRPLKPLVLVSIGAAAATAEVDSACNRPVLTVYVNAPSSPTSETIYAVNTASSVTEGGAASSNTITTVTKSFISTQIISIIQATAPAGVYFFAEENGTTTWLGGETPPATASLNTSTAFITLQPIVSVSSPTEGKTPQSTNYLEISSTITVTETSTSTLTATSVSAPTAPAGAYTGLASSGWNATMTTLRKVTISGEPSHYQAGIKDMAVSLAGTAYPLATYSGTWAHRLIPRQAISAKIDGVLVSWTNNYVGLTSSNPQTSEVLVPVTATALAFGPSFITTSSSSNPEPTHTWFPVTATAPAFGPFPTTIPGPTVSPAETSSSSPQDPTTTGGTYPWDLSPVPSPVPSPSTTSTSSTMSSLSVTLSFSSSAIWSNSTMSLVPASTTTALSCDGVFVSPRFTIDFDDLPYFSTGSDPNGTDNPPIFNPYRKMYFEGHFGYVPPPTDPFPPHSPPQLAVYREEGLNFDISPDADLELIGEIGAGPRAFDSAYWIDAYSAWLGCANAGPDDCEITVRGYQKGANVSTITQAFMQPPCPGLKNCSLALVEFADGFRNLTGLQIIAKVDVKPVDWYMDDLALGWSNNTCAAQLERSSSE